MEFASDLVVRSALEGLKIVEVPTTLSKDGRSRPPHLRTWRDGWRHLKFLLTYSPRWLFLYPGSRSWRWAAWWWCCCFPGPFQVGHVGFENKTFIVGCLCLIVGVQSITFSLLGRRYASSRGVSAAAPALRRPAGAADPGAARPGGTRLFRAGMRRGRLVLPAVERDPVRPLDSPIATRLMVFSVTLLVAATQTFLAAFLGAVMEVGKEIGDR